MQKLIEKFLKLHAMNHFEKHIIDEVPRSIDWQMANFIENSDKLPN